MENFLEISETFLINADSEMIENFIKYFCKYDNKFITPEKLKIIFTGMSLTDKDKFIDKNIQLLCSIQDTGIVDLLIKNGIDINRILDIASDNKNLVVVNFLLQSNHNINFGEFFIKQCHLMSDMNIIKLLLEKGIPKEDIDRAFYFASYFSHIDLMKYLLKYGTKCSIATFFKLVCNHKRKEIIELIINEALNENDLDEALNYVCKYDYYIWIDLLIQKGATNLNQALLTACRNLQHNCVDMLIKNGATNLNEALIISCENDCNDSINSCIKLLINNGASNLNEALYVAYKYRNITRVKLLIKKGATNLNEILIAICEKKYNYYDYTCIKLLIDNGATNLNEALLATCKYNNNDYYYAKLLIKRGATNLNEALLEASKNGHDRTILTLIKNGATNIGHVLKNTDWEKQAKIMDVIMKNSNLDDPVNILNFLDNLDIDSEKNESANFLDTRKKLMYLYHNAQLINLWLKNEKLFEYVVKYNLDIKMENIYNLDTGNIITLLLHKHIVSFEGKYFCMKDALLLLYYNFFCSEPIEFFDMNNSLPLNINQTFRLKKIEAFSLHLIFHKKSEYGFTQPNGVELLRDYLNDCLWKPNRHQLFPNKTKKDIEIFLLCIKLFSNNNLYYKIPKPLQYIIINYFIIKK